MKLKERKVRDCQPKETIELPCNLIQEEKYEQDGKQRLKTKKESIVQNNLLTYFRGREKERGGGGR